MIYLDNAATTKPCEQAIKAAEDAARSCFGNVSSLHRLGIESEKLMNSAKKTILKKLGLQGEIYFTSGATESNNLAIRGVADAYKRRGNKIVTTAMEHPSVARTMDYLEKLGFEIVRLSPKDAIDNFEQYIADNVTQDTILVSCMAVNNENGFKVNTEKLYRLVKNANSETIVHIDGVQGFCKVTLKGDLISLSGHKIHGFKGIGAMYCADKIRFTPLVYGGGQQKNMRSGTDNVPGIAGMALAASMCYDHLEEKVEYMRQIKSHFVEEVLKLPDTVVHGLYDETSAPHIISVGFAGVRSEVLLHALEDKGICVSAGSACASNHPAISGVLKGIGAKKEYLDATIRFSMSEMTTEEEMDYTLQALQELVPMLRRYTRH